jgi:hypothetical protein
VSDTNELDSVFVEEPIADVPDAQEPSDDDDVAAKIEAKLASLAKYFD